MKQRIGVLKARRAARQRDMALIGNALQMVTILALVFAVSSKDTKVVLLPTTGGETLVVEGSNPDQKYLARICRDVGQLFMNQHPKSTQFNKDALLGMSLPSAYGRINATYDRLKDDIGERRISSVYYVKQVLADTQTLECRLTGDFETYLGKERMGSREREFVVSMARELDRLWLSDFYENSKTETQASK